MENGSKAKVSGYLEKKGKMRMVSTWKKYWFVLEGRLLLYYRSKEEYDARLSPCKGSINLGPPCTVKSYPSMACVFQIEARANTITLRAESPSDQTKWMQAIMLALNQNQSVRTEATRLSHFRYSLDDLVPKNEPCCTPLTKKLERQNTMPDRLKLAQRNSNEIITRLQKMGGVRPYGGSGVIERIHSGENSPRSPQKSQSQMSLNQIRENNDRDTIYERISGDSAIMVDNDQYSIPNKVRRSGTQSNRESVLVVENDQYSPIPSPAQDEVIYAEPSIDVNKNLMVDNNIYSRDSKSDENEYEESEGHYSQLVFNKTEDNGGGKKKKARKKLLNLINNNDNKEEKRLKKSQSFIKRVWKRKNKKREKNEEESDIYEEVGKIAENKVDLSDGSAVQILSELQTILENKNVVLKRTISSQSGRSEDRRSEDRRSEDRRTEDRCSEDRRSEDRHSEGRRNEDRRGEDRHGEDRRGEDGRGEDRRSEENPKEIVENCPLVPPKSKSKSYETDQEEVRSIDEILEDLDQQEVEPKTKVKMLIDKFESEDEVTIREHKPVRAYRHSDELNHLLNELAKVTNAPIMTPGVTTSLVNPNLSDDEWLKILPIRQRRLSDPDYDVPRAHRSIQAPKKNPADAIPATRFFGPVLPQPDESSSKEDVCVSMTPDSLEVEDCQKQFSYTSHNYHYHQCKAMENFFGNNLLKRSSHNLNREDELAIYSAPKPYISTRIVNTCQNICIEDDENAVIYKNVKNIDRHHEEVFNDSLEMCNESSTEF